MPKNHISTKNFRSKSFIDDLTTASRAKSTTIIDQIRYLARYCERLGAKTVVKEERYIDRHFLDEHAQYYCRTLDPPPTYVQRFHIFSRAFSDSELGGFFEKNIKYKKEKSLSFCKKLSAEYLGFITIRPIPLVPVGRTVLRRIEDGETRDIWATGTHAIHLANLTLEVDGLVFQQQDVAVGACATAALWSSLSRVMRREGMRAPTPAEISEAASRRKITNGRIIPVASGLSVQQLCEIIRTFGFVPETVVTNEDPEILAVAIHTYLLSGIPVVLILQGPLGSHAVTAVGFQAGSECDPILGMSIPVRSARIRKLYIHDDRLGPYARAFLIPIPKNTKSQKNLTLKIERERQNLSADAPLEPASVEAWTVSSLIAPVYPKLRLSASSLITLGELHGSLLEEVVGEPQATALGVEFYYERSGSYLAKLQGRADPRCSNFLRSIVLPRWCGIVRWFLGDRQLAEFIYDTTDILRNEGSFGAELLRGIVCLDPFFRCDFFRIAEYFKVPCA